MKKVFWRVLTAVLVLIFFLAASAANAGDYSLAFSTKILPRYVSGSSGAVFYDRPVLQTDLFLTMPHGLWFDLWLSKGLDDFGLAENYSNEVDYGFGWTGEIKTLCITAGVYYFDLMKVLRVPSGDLVQPFLEVSKTFSLTKTHTVSPYGRFEYLFSADQKIWSGTRNFSHAGLKHGWKISQKWSISQRMNLIYDSGGLGGAENTTLGQYGLTVNWMVTENFTVNPLIYTFSAPLNPVNDGRTAQNVIGFGISYVLK